MVSAADRAVLVELGRFLAVIRTRDLAGLRQLVFFILPDVDEVALFGPDNPDHVFFQATLYVFEETCDGLGLHLSLAPSPVVEESELPLVTPSRHTQTCLDDPDQLLRCEVIVQDCPLSTSGGDHRRLAGVDPFGPDNFGDGARKPRLFERHVKALLSACSLGYPLPPGYRNRSCCFMPSTRSLTIQMGCSSLAANAKL